MTGNGVVTGVSVAHQRAAREPLVPRGGEVTAESTPGDGSEFEHRGAGGKFTISHVAGYGMLYQLTGEQLYADATGAITALKPAAITLREPLSISIMPEGLPAALTVDELRDLVAYLSQLK